MKKTITAFVTLIGLVAIALVIYYKPIYPAPSNCNICCSEDCPSDRPLTIPSQDSQVQETIRNFRFSFNMEAKNPDQIYYISQEKDKNFVILAHVLEKNKTGSIKSLRFTLINSEGNFYVVKDITQPIITARYEGKEKKRTLLIDFTYKERDCNLTYIPAYKDYTIEKKENFIHRNDIIVHLEKTTHNLKEAVTSSLNEVKSFSVGEHICRVIFE
jgi:hypothetical protein